MYGVLMIDIDSTALTAEDVSLIKQAQVGGVILFARNVENAHKCASSVMISVITTLIF